MTSMFAPQNGSLYWAVSNGNYPNKNTESSVMEDTEYLVLDENLMLDEHLLEKSHQTATTVCNAIAEKTDLYRPTISTKDEEYILTWDRVQVKVFMDRLYLNNVVYCICNTCLTGQGQSKNQSHFKESPLDLFLQDLTKIWRQSPDSEIYISENYNLENYNLENYNLENYNLENYNLENKYYVPDEPPTAYDNGLFDDKGSSDDEMDVDNEYFHWS